MNPALNTQWFRLEKLRKQYVKTIKEASPVQQRLKVDASGWNMLQVLHHLILAEKLSMEYLIRKQYGNARKGSNFAAFFRSMTLRFLLQSPLRFKAPRVLKAPLEDPDPESLLKEWEQVRQGMYEYLQHFPDDKLSMLIYRHPRAGWLTIQQALEFFEDHLVHHQQQLRRIRQTQGFYA